MSHDSHTLVTMLWAFYLGMIHFGIVVEERHILLLTLLFEFKHGLTTRATSVQRKLKHNYVACSQTEMAIPRRALVAMNYTRHAVLIVQ